METTVVSVRGYSQSKNQSGPSASEKQHSQQNPAAGVLWDGQMSGGPCSCFWSLHYPSRWAPTLTTRSQITIDLSYQRQWKNNNIFSQMLNNPSIHLLIILPGQGSLANSRGAHIVNGAQTNLMQSVICGRTDALFLSAFPPGSSSIQSIHGWQWKCEWWKESSKGNSWRKHVSGEETAWEEIYSPAKSQWSRFICASDEPFGRYLRSSCRCRQNTARRFSLLLSSSFTYFSFFFSSRCNLRNYIKRHQEQTAPLEKKKVKSHHETSRWKNAAALFVVMNVN